MLIVGYFTYILLLPPVTVVPFPSIIVITHHLDHFSCTHARIIIMSCLRRLRMGRATLLNLQYPSNPVPPDDHDDTQLASAANELSLM